jgi:hypothetical protein
MQELRRKTEEQIEEELLPFGFIDVGEEVQTGGWTVVEEEDNTGWNF